MKNLGGWDFIFPFTLSPDLSGKGQTNGKSMADYFAAVMVRQASFVKLRTGSTNGFISLSPRTAL
jgi:hypothetical protein